MWGRRKKKKLILLKMGKDILHEKLCSPHSSESSYSSSLL